MLKSGNTATRLSVSYVPDFLLLKIGSISCFPARPLIDDYRTLNIHAVAANQLSSAHGANLSVAAPMVIVTGQGVAVMAPFTEISEERDSHIFFIFNVDNCYTAAVRLQGVLSADQASIIISHFPSPSIMQRSSGRQSEVHTMRPPTGARPGRNRRSHRR